MITSWATISEGSTAKFSAAWEQEYNHSQAVKVGDTIYLVRLPPRDEKGDIAGIGDMEAQMQQALR